MLIFQRFVTFSGPPQEIAPWAVDITAHVNERTDLDLALWQGISGGPLGTLAWSTLVESMTALEVATDALAVDAEYLDKVSAAADWTTEPGQDVILRVLHVAGGDYVRPDVGAYAETTTAVPAEGKLAKAGQFAVEIADVHSRLTHSTVLLCSNEYGAYGELHWLGLYPNAAEVDRAAELIAKDASYTEAIDAAAGLLVEGMSTRTLGRRIA